MKKLSLPPRSASAAIRAGPAAGRRPIRRAILETYADIAQAAYEDSLTASPRTCDDAIDALVAEPDRAQPGRAREAWRRPRVPYQQTEAFRFGNPHRRRLGGQGQRLAARRGPDRLCRRRATAPSPTRTRSTPPTSSPTRTDDRRHRRSTRPTITPALLQDTLQEIGGIEANVATGYHAIEFLLWGQDLNGTGPGAGDRPGDRLRHAPTAPTATATGAPPICMAATRPAGRRPRGHGRRLGRRAARPAPTSWTARRGGPRAII